MLRIKGSAMCAHSADRLIALAMWKYGILEKSEFTFARMRCAAGMNVVDVGANIGLYTLAFARIVGSSGHVWAFEPDALNFSSLQKNISQNGYTNVTVEQAALGATPKVATLYRSTSHHGDHRLFYQGEDRDEIVCRVMTLDEYLPIGQRVDLIKIDVQGSEGAVLQGMTRVMRENPNLELFIEFWPEGLIAANTDPHAILALLREHGFVPSYIKQEGSLPWKDTMEALVRTARSEGYLNLFFSRCP